MKFWKPLAALLSLCISASAMAQNLTLSFGTQLPETHVVVQGHHDTQDLSGRAAR